MNKPEKKGNPTPKDVARAKEIISAVSMAQINGNLQNLDDSQEWFIEKVASALADERERCAKVAEKYRGYARSKETTTTKIISAIRNRGGNHDE